MMHVENKYRVERLENKDFTTSWGLLDLDKKTIAIENLLNDMYEKGYQFNNVVFDKDNLAINVDYYIFMKEQTAMK